LKGLMIAETSFIGVTFPCCVATSRIISGPDMRTM